MSLLHQQLLMSAVAAPSAPTIVGTPSIALNGGTSWTSTAPSGRAAGNTLVLMLYGDVSSTSNLVTPTGWASQGKAATTSPDGQGLAVFTRTADGTSADNVSQSWTGALNRNFVTVMTAWSGVVSIIASSISTNTSNNASPITLTAPTVTATSANSIWMLGFCIDITSGTAASPFGAISGFTQAANQGNSASFADAAGAVYYKTVSSGATGTQNCTETGLPGGWLSISIILSPA